MGNCCMSGSSSMLWAGDDWGSMGRTGPGPADDEAKEGLLGGNVAARAELRIKISNKQLQELLRRAEEGGPWGLRKKGEGGKVLERLIKRSVRVEVRRRSWRPKLPTISEVY